jgi:uncharacterized RDD family membrane protein YckC
VLDAFAQVTLLVVLAALAFVDLDELSAGVTPEFTTGEQYLFQGLAIAISALYTIPAIARWGQTPGRFAVGVRVVRIADGRVPDLGQSAIRFLVPSVAVLVPFVGPVLALVVLGRAALRPDRRGWHDHAAGTIVLRSRARPPEFEPGG